MTSRTSSSSQSATSTASTRKVPGSSSAPRRGPATTSTTTTTTSSSTAGSNPPSSTSTPTTVLSTSSTPASTTSSTPRPSSPATTTPNRDLTTLLHLPIRLTLIPNGSIPEREVEGTLWAYDSTTSCVILSSPVTGKAQAKNPTTAQNPVTKKRCYHLIKTPQIKKVEVLSLEPDSSIPHPSELLKAVNLKEVEARVEKAVREDKKERARIGLGVTEEAQALFDALGRTLPVRWSNTDIVVMDEVLITSPYSMADVKGNAGSEERIERVRKVLEGERQRRLERQT